MQLSTLITQTGEWAESKGWNDEPRSIGDWCALFHSEISEALEEHRRGRLPSEVYYSTDDDGQPKPEGIPIEIADLVLRIAHFCDFYDINLEASITEKHEYNTGRKYRHGGKSL